MRLHLSQQSRLLVGLVHYVGTPVGRGPTRIDYADHRNVDAIKLSFRWIIAYPGESVTIQVDQIKLSQWTT